MTNADSSRERIVRTAQRLIHNRSYTDVGVAEICAEAGVKKGSFYHFFPSKRELALAILDDYLAKWGPGLKAIAQDAAVPPMERILRIALAIAERQEALHEETGHVPGCPFGNIAAELSTKDEIIRARVERIYADLETVFETLLREALARGDAPALDPRATAQAMFAYLEGILLTAKIRNTPRMIRELAPAIVKLLVPPGKAGKE
jgi:TetR/AcrR family transcriptional repressor of nem operon